MSSGEEVVNGGVEDGASAGKKERGDQPADVLTELLSELTTDVKEDVETDHEIWRAFLNSDVPGQKYWIVKDKERHKICRHFSELRTYLQTHEEQKKFTIYSTSSPSAEESTVFTTLQQGFPGVRLIIKIASMIPEVNDEHTSKLWTLSRLENVSVEEFQGFDDWQTLSTCLRQGYTKEEYDRERKDEQTSTALHEALDIKDVPDDVEPVFTKTNQPKYYQNMPQTYCVVHGSGSKPLFFKNTLGLHAEKNMVDHFTGIYGGRGEETIPTIKLIVYLSRAPCGKPDKNCAGQLQTLCESKNLKMDIYAVGPHYNNEAELKALVGSKRATLSTFSKKVFDSLAELLGQESWVYTSDMETRDGDTRRRFESAFGKTPLVEGRWEYTDI